MYTKGEWDFTMIKKNLTVNLWQYAKLLFYGAVAAGFSWFILDASKKNLYPGWSEKIAELWVQIAIYVVLACGCIVILYALLSCVINKAVFDIDSLKYRTLFKRYCIRYSDIAKIDALRETTRKQGSLVTRTKLVYTVNTSTGSYTLSSHEFFGLRKQIDLLKLHMKGDKNNGN